jgi:hypothetical protein
MAVCCLDNDDARRDGKAIGSTVHTSNSNLNFFNKA